MKAGADIRLEGGEIIEDSSSSDRIVADCESLEDVSKQHPHSGVSAGEKTTQTRIDGDESYRARMEQQVKRYSGSSSCFGFLGTELRGPGAHATHGPGTARFPQDGSGTGTSKPG